MERFLNPKRLGWLVELNRGPVLASRAWWIRGKTEFLMRMEDAGMVACVGRDGTPVHPSEDLARWVITEQGRTWIENSV